MEITLFGVLWTVVLLCAGIMSQKALVKCVIISALFQAGAVIIIGDSLITPLTFSCLIYIIFGLYKHKLNIKIPKFLIAFFVMWLVILFSSILSSVLFQGTVIQRVDGFLAHLTETYQGHISLYGLTELLLYGITATLIFNDKPLNAKDFDKLIDFEFWFVLIIGLWQFITKLGVIPRISLIEKLVYSNTASNSLVYYATSFPRSLLQNQFYSSFMEPSYLSGFLGAIFYYYISKFIKEKHILKNGIKTILTFCMVVISFSTTAYAVVALACLICLIQFNKDKRIIRALGIGLLAIFTSIVIINSFGLWEKIIRSSIEKFNTNSAMIRNTWDEACIQAFKDTIGIGVGYGNLSGSGFAFTLLGSIGIIGSLSYLLFIISVLRKKSIVLNGHDDCMSIDIAQYKIMLILCIAAQLVAVGRFNYSIFWMVLFILIAAYTSTTSEIERKNKYEKTVHYDFYEGKPFGEI